SAAADRLEREARRALLDVGVALGRIAHPRQVRLDVAALLGVERAPGPEHERRVLRQDRAPELFDVIVPAHDPAILRPCPSGGNPSSTTIMCTCGASTTPQRPPPTSTACGSCSTSGRAPACSTRRVATGGSPSRWPRAAPSCSASINRSRSSPTPSATATASAAIV